MTAWRNLSEEEYSKKLAEIEAASTPGKK